MVNHTKNNTVDCKCSVCIKISKIKHELKLLRYESEKKLAFDRHVNERELMIAEYEAHKEIGRLNHENGFCDQNISPAPLVNSFNLPSEDEPLLKYFSRSILVLVVFTSMYVKPYYSLVSLKLFFKASICKIISFEFLKYQIAIGHATNFWTKLFWFVFLFCFNVSYWGMPALTIFNGFF